MIDTNFNKNNFIDNSGQKQATRVQHDQSVKNTVESKTSAGVRKKTITKIAECKTCAQRISQSSSDISFSFLSVSPSNNNSSNNNSSNNNSVDSPSTETSMVQEPHQHTVSMHISVCPECGKAYMRGAPSQPGTVSVQEEEKRTQGTLFDASI